MRGTRFVIDSSTLAVPRWAPYQEQEGEEEEEEQGRGTMGGAIERERGVMAVIVKGRTGEGREQEGRIAASRLPPPLC